MSKYVIILRGIPGSGKSTFANKLALAWSDSVSGEIAVIHSTDALCVVDGDYQFSSELAGERHEQNLQNFKTSLAKGEACVICDNTNIKFEQYSPYVKAAEDEGYRVVFVEMPHPSPSLAATRTVHSVPVSVINDMVLGWEPSQHCAHERTKNALRLVKKIQDSSKSAMFTSFLVGIFLGVSLSCLFNLIFI